MEKGKALAFLEGITLKDRVSIITHNDFDGVAAGLQIDEYLSPRGCKISVHFISIGHDTITKIYSKVKGTKIIVMDLSIAAVPELEKLNEDILYIDHHFSNKRINRKNVIEVRPEGYVPASKMVYDLLKINPLMAAGGTVADAGDKYNENKRFINGFLRSQKLSGIEFKENFVYLISRALVYFEGKTDKAFSILKTIVEVSDVKKLKRYSDIIGDEIDKAVSDYDNKNITEGIVHYYSFTAKHSIKSIVISIISARAKDDIYVFANESGNKIRISVRCLTGKHNTLKILETATKGLLGSTYGGHVPASGGIIRKSDLPRFLANLKKIK